MPVWLLVQVDLRLNDGSSPVYPQNYRPNMQVEGGGLYYGVHFVSGPAKLSSGEKAVVDLVFRAFPQDPCADFQVGRKVFLKDGPSPRAEGTILQRWEHESNSKTLPELQREIAPEGFQ